MLEGFLEVPILQGSSFMSITVNGINFNKNVVKIQFSFIAMKKT